MMMMKLLKVKLMSKDLYLVKKLLNYKVFLYIYFIIEITISNGPKLRLRCAS